MGQEKVKKVEGCSGGKKSQEIIEKSPDSGSLGVGSPAFDEMKSGKKSGQKSQN
jgi:hypothetical protein